MAIALNNHQVVRSTANTDSYTLSSYAVPSGNDRVLVVMISGMRSNDTANIVLSGVTFGAASLTEAVSITDTSTSRYYYTGIWYLVNPAVSTANISFTINSGNLIGAIISAATLTGVDQTTPIAGYTSVSTTGAGIAFDPVDSGGDATWVGHRGELALAAVSASANNNPTWDWDNGDLYDLNNGTSSNSEIAGSGAAYASYPIVACSISPARTVGVAVGFNEAAGDEIATSAASSATSTAVSTPRLAAKVAAASSVTSTATASASVLRSTTAASAATSAASAVPTVPAGPNETLLTGLEAWYSLGESSGTRVDAHSGNDLTDINTVGSTTGKVGNAALFARASNERLERSSAFLAPSGGFTIAGWLYKTADNAMTIASQWNEDGVNQRGWRLYSSAGTNLRLQTSRDGTFGTTAEVNTTISNSAWYWFCAWFDPATSTIAISLNNGTPVTATQTDVYTSPAKFVMGAIETSTGGTQHWDGRLDEIAVWDRVLTSDERTWLYNGGSGRAYSDLGNGSVVNTSGSTSASSVASASPFVARQGAASASASSSASAVLSALKESSASVAASSSVAAAVSSMHYVSASATLTGYLTLSATGSSAAPSGQTAGAVSATSSASATPSIAKESAATTSATSSAAASTSAVRSVTASSAATSSVNGVATVYGASTVAGESTAQSGASASPSLLRAVTGEAEATSTTAVSPSLATGVSGASSATSSATGVTEVSRLTSGSLSAASTAAAYPYSESEAYVRGETGAVSGASASVSLSLPVAGSLAAASNAAAASMATSPAAGSTQAVSGASGVASVTRGVSAEAGATSGADAVSSMAVGVSGTLDASSAANADAMMAWFTGGSVSAQSGAESLLRSLLLTAAASGASSDAMAIAIVMAAPMVIYRGTVYGASKIGVVDGVKKRGIVLSSGDLNYTSEG